MTSQQKEFYLSKFGNKIFVVKIGGEVIKSKEILENILKDIKEISNSGIKVILVHGGGTQADDMAKLIGHVPQKVNGRRITTEKDIEIVKMLYGGSMNLEILSIMKKLNMKGIRVSGLDGNLLQVKIRPKKKIDYGFVGDIHGVNSEVLFDLLEKGYLPIVAPLAVTDEGTILNINADTIATELAIDLQAEKLILFTNTDGVLQGGERISTLDTKEANNLIKKKIVAAGMLVKIENCIQAIKKGVKRVHILNGLSTHSLLKEILTKKGIGTMITSTNEKHIYISEQNKKIKLPSYTTHFKGKKSGPKVVIMGGLHGNEPTGVKVIEKLKTILPKEQIHGEIYLVLGNPKACAAKKRFLDCDLNRIFHLNFPKPYNIEEKRALEIAPILEKADYLLDIHSTQKQSAPFVYTNSTLQHLKLARIFDTRYIVTGSGDFKTKKTTVSSDNFVDSHGGIGLTYESGWNKDFGQVAKTLEKTKDFLCTIGVAFHKQKIKKSQQAQILEVQEILAAQSEDFKFSRNYINFDLVKKQRTIAKENNRSIKRPYDCYIVFPKETACYLAKSYD